MDPAGRTEPARLARMLGALFLAIATGSGDAPVTTLPVASDDFGIGAIAGALVFATLAALPLALSLWALLDAARRPRWAWALSGRRQVVWMAAIMMAAIVLVVGVAVSWWYLTRIRRESAAIEHGDF